MSRAKQKPVELFTVKAWSANAIAFIESEGLTRQFSDWCGGWPCPVSPELVQAAPELLSTLIALEKWFDTDPEVLEALPEADRADNARQLAKIRAAIAKAKGGAA